MCEPTTLLAAATFAVGAGKAVAGNVAQNQQAKAVKKSATASLVEDLRALTMRQQQEQQAGDQTILEQDRQARLTKGMAAVSAGESGVAGASVDLLLGDIDRQRAEADTIAQRNTAMTLAQLEQQKQGARVDAANRIASVPKASNLLTGLQIASAGLDLGSQLIRNRPTAGGNG